MEVIYGWIWNTARLFPPMGLSTLSLRTMVNSDWSAYQSTFATPIGMMELTCLILPDFVVFILQAGENCIFAALLQSKVSYTCKYRAILLRDSIFQQTPECSRCCILAT